MIKTSWMLILGRLIPEAFILILSTYTILRKKVDKPRMVFSTILLSISVYFSQTIPISYGVHIIINIINLIVINALINKIDISATIKASMITAIMFFILESLNILGIMILVPSKISYILNNDLMKIIFFSPSLLLLYSIVIGRYSYLKCRIMLNDNYNSRGERSRYD